MATKRKIRSTIKIVSKLKHGPHDKAKEVWVDADDWEITNGIHGAFNLTAMLPRCNDSHGLLRLVDIDEEDDQKRIIGFKLLAETEFQQQLDQPLPDMSRLDALKSLTVDLMFGYEYRYLGIGDLPNLEKLQVASLLPHFPLRSVFRYSSPRPRPLPSLKYLDLKDCRMLEAIPEEIGLLGQSLEHLEMDVSWIVHTLFSRNRHAEMLEVFPQSMKQLTNLKCVHLRCITPCEVVSVDTAPVFSCWTKLQMIRTGLDGLKILFPSPNDDSVFKPYSCWALLRTAIVRLPTIGGETQDRIACAFRTLATWKQIETLAFHRSSGDKYFVPLSMLSPLGKNLTKLSLRTDTPLRHPLPETLVSLQDLHFFTNLKEFHIHRAQFVPHSSNKNYMDMQAQEATHLPPSMTRLELVQCMGFFTKETMAIHCLSQTLDLSNLTVFRLTKTGSELGDEEFVSLCKNIFQKCPRIQEIDLSDGNICHLNIESCNQTDKITIPGDLVVSCLPSRSLRVLDLSRNTALSLPDGTPAEKDANIRALWYWAAKFPYLGYLGKFNMLFLGRLGEDYGRLGEYYRIIHHLALNRARSRILMEQRVSLGLWANILERSQRAFDDYPGYLISYNRKQEPDAIFHLLKERGAKEIFNF
ncbi:hypothetical protein IV203_011431 [Nitzschia inconspicua]|uniref:Uncharacterized protein n=1 Tax=Nitzschia inconspicua TaxID=303405 RepID=A0A9K3KT60_9STRA|nr:hypothetical protein IV203_011431 [Nitzschia inconspicua]